MKCLVTVAEFGQDGKSLSAAMSKQAGNKPGKWWLIVDLSYPHGSSVNDGISSGDASMAYASIEDAGWITSSLGQFTLLAKINIASVFRIITVHPDDRHLLGMKWNSAIYIDKQLLFGLRSPGRSPPFRHEME